MSVKFSTDSFAEPSSQASIDFNWCLIPLSGWALRPEEGITKIGRRKMELRDEDLELLGPFPKTTSTERDKSPKQLIFMIASFEDSSWIKQLKT